MTLSILLIVFALAVAFPLVLSGSYPPLADTFHQIWWNVRTLPMELLAAFKAASGPIALDGMNREEYEAVRFLPAGTTVWEDHEGRTVKVLHQRSEIALAHRAVTPNFAPTDTVIGFAGFGGRSTVPGPLAPYWTPNVHRMRPALYPRISDAIAALKAGTQVEPNRRVFYHTDTAASFAQYMQAVGDVQRDEAKDGTIG